MTTSSNFRWCACLRACASKRVVLSSSMVTRRPRSAIKSMAFLLPNSLFLLATRPALPHAEFEHGEIDGFQQTARRHHDVGRGNRARRHRHELFAGVDARG